MAQAVGRHMLDAGYGRIVNIASQAAHVGIDGHAAYCASKAGVIGLTPCSHSSGAAAASP